MRVSVLRNPDGRFRRKFHRHDSHDCGGRRMHEEKHADWSDYVLVDLGKLPGSLGRASSSAASPVCPTPPRSPSATRVARRSAMSRQGAAGKGVAIGSKVTCRDVASGELKRREIVGGRRGDQGRGEVSPESPIAPALVGHRAGRGADRVASMLPRGGDRRGWPGELTYHADGHHAPLRARSYVVRLPWRCHRDDPGRVALDNGPPSGAGADEPVVPAAEPRGEGACSAADRSHRGRRPLPRSRRGLRSWPPGLPRVCRRYPPAARCAGVPSDVAALSVDVRGARAYRPDGLVLARVSAVRGERAAPRERMRAPQLSRPRNCSLCVAMGLGASASAPRPSSVGPGDPLQPPAPDTAGSPA
jgi:hypothetical protein